MTPSATTRPATPSGAFGARGASSRTAPATRSEGRPALAARPPSRAADDDDDDDDDEKDADDRRRLHGPAAPRRAALPRGPGARGRPRDLDLDLDDDLDDDDHLDLDGPSIRHGRPGRRLRPRRRHLPRAVVLEDRARGVRMGRHRGRPARPIGPRRVAVSVVRRVVRRLLPRVRRALVARSKARDGGRVAPAAEDRRPAAPRVWAQGVHAHDGRRGIRPSGGLVCALVANKIVGDESVGGSSSRLRRGGEAGDVRRRCGGRPSVSCVTATADVGLPPPRSWRARASSRARFARGSRPATACPPTSCPHRPGVVRRSRTRRR